MKLLLQYLRPYRSLVLLALALAAINQSFSMMDPIIFGNVIDLAYHRADYTQAAFLLAASVWLLKSMGVAMISRIAKAFQDYFTNVVIQKFGARIFTDGLRHSMRLPYSEFEDQRSGETLSILTKVRTDTERFISAFINVVFGILVGVVFVSVYAFSKHWAIMPIYLVGIFFLSWLTNFLSKKIRAISTHLFLHL